MLTYISETGRFTTILYLPFNSCINRHYWIKLKLKHKYNNYDKLCF